MLQKKPGISIFLPFATGAAVLLLANCAHTTSTPPQVASRGHIGYLTNAEGEVVRSGSGGCIRTGSWEPQYAIKECEPQLVAQAEPPAPQPEATASAAEPQAQSAEPAQAQAEQTAPAEPVRVFVGVDTYFPFNKAELTPDMQSKLERIAERAKQSEDASIRIVGFADQIGSPDYNFSLSQRRADAVRTYFIEQGLPENALSVDARGETDPIVQCEGRQGTSLIDCLQPNRRTEVEFSALEQPQ